MSDHKEDKPDAAKAAADSKGSGKASPIPLIGAAVGALVLGSVLGIFVVAPRIVAARAPVEADSASAGEHGKKSEKKKKEKGGHGEKKEKGSHGGGHGESEGEGGAVHRIENLIVNPAGSQGRRFLMMTVAFEVPDAKDEATLREKDAMLRDAIIGALEGQSITTITSPGGRDSVKVAIRRAVAPLVEDFDYVNIYLPQFVLQ
jgi:flagellar FliL protein